MTYECLSMSDPAKIGLKFRDEMDAIRHRDLMNSLRDNFSAETGWNVDYWKSKPTEWIVREITK